MVSGKPSYFRDVVIPTSEIEPVNIQAPCTQKWAADFMVGLVSIVCVCLQSSTNLLRSPRKPPGPRSVDFPTSSRVFEMVFLFPDEDKAVFECCPDGFHRRRVYSVVQRVKHRHLYFSFSPMKTIFGFALNNFSSRPGNCSKSV